MEQTFLRFIDVGGNVHSKALIREPRPLELEKDGNRVCACILEACPLSREFGHRGISLCHYCFDGDLNSILFRRMRHHYLERGGLAGKSQGAGSSIGFPKLRRASLTLYFLVRSLASPLPMPAAVVRRVVARTPDSVCMFSYCLSCRSLGEAVT